ncbi:efflux RND transporter periplasmic adaptor subunit [Cerasicoccus arenae]
MRLLFSRLRWNGLLAGMLAGLFVFANTAQAAADDFVAAQGLITPKNGLIHVAAPAGLTGQAIINELKVKAGEQVVAGQVIAVLAGRAVAEADLVVAKLEVAATSTAPAIIQAQIDTIASQIAAAESEVATAEAQVKAAEAAVAQAQAGVVQAQKGRREAMETLDASLAKITGTNAAYQNTLDELDPPRRETEEIKFQQKLLNEEYRAADAPRFAMGARIDADVAAAEAAVVTAQANVPVVQAQVESARQNVAHVKVQQSILEAELTRAKAVAAAAQGGIDQAQAHLDLTEVKAPSAGVVLYVGARPGEAVGPAGVVILGDLSELYVDAEVYIDDVRKVKPGQKVTVKSDAFLGEIAGVVSEVGQLVNPQGVFSSDPMAYSDKRVVVARIKLSPPFGVIPPVHAQVIARINVQGAGK